MKKIILADNQSIFRTGTAKVLAAQEDFRIVAQCLDAERLQHAITAFPCSIVIFSSTLQPEYGPLVQAIHDASSRAILIAENNEPPRSFTGKALDGTLFRDVSAPVLVECVQRVSAGSTYAQPRFGHRPSQEEQDSVGARVRQRLTPKEIKIVALIVEGYKNKEIAAQLGTTEQVIKNYLRSVYDKTGVSDRLELALFTLHHRVLSQTSSVKSVTNTLHAASA
ncbi:MAG: response regulator transcription factor [Acidobacteriaceae bacterium]